MNIGPCRRLVLLGGGSLLLQIARKWGNEVSIITSPRHAEEKIGEKTFKDSCLEQGIPLLITARIDTEEARSFIGSMEDTFALAKGAAWIFTQEIINTLFENKLFNSHGTRLPLDRGGGGFSWQIMRGDRIGVCLLHHVDSGIDTGDILASGEFIFPAACRLPQDYLDYHDEKNLTFLATILHRIAQEEVTLNPLPQPHYLSRYNPRLSTEENGWIDWSWPLPDLERFICAFDVPYGGAKTLWKKNTISLRNVFAQFSGGRHPYEAGIITHVGEWIVVSANGGELLVTNVEDEDGRSVRQSLSPGDRLANTPYRLFSARQRVSYDAHGAINHL